VTDIPHADVVPRSARADADGLGAAALEAAVEVRCEGERVRALPPARWRPTPDDVAGASPA
jgi:hypothetical protein